MTEALFQLGKYRIVAELGAGGFATVYQAVDTTLDRVVALKILHPPLLADRRFVQNFHREARTLAALRHPHIVTVYEVGEIDGRLFIAMDLAPGLSLAQAIGARGRIPWSETLTLLQPIGEALDYAHGRNVVHRDLKPANILLGERGALLTDFGFARLMAENSASMSLSGGIVGTPGYIAPEVWEDNAANPTVDIYALGCIVYEMLTGVVLFKGQTPIQAMRAHDRGPQFPESWPADVPANLAAVLSTALAREPAARYPSAGALWQALSDLAAQEQAAAASRETARRADEAQQAAQQRAALSAKWRAEAAQALAANDIALVRKTIESWRAQLPDDPALQEAQAELGRRVRAAREATQQELAAQHRAEAERAIDAQEWDAARKAIEDWRVTAPQDMAIGEMQARLEHPAPPAPGDMPTNVLPLASTIEPPLSERSTAVAQPESTKVSPEPTKRIIRRPAGIVGYLLVLGIIAIITIIIIGILILLGNRVQNVFTGLSISTNGETLQFSPELLVANANQLTTVNFKNDSATQQHNWVLVNGGDDIAHEVDLLGVSAGADQDYLPDSPRIVAHIGLLSPGANSSASFTLPSGTYTFLCTFPSHYAAGMKGTLTVK